MPCIRSTAGVCHIDCRNAARHSILDRAVSLTHCNSLGQALQHNDTTTHHLSSADHDINESTLYQTAGRTNLYTSTAAVLAYLSYKACHHKLSLQLDSPC